MIGQVTESLAMEPGVRTIEGYQAECRTCEPDVPHVVGTHRLTWIDAHLDLLLHNMEKHGHEFAPAVSPWA